MKQRIIKKLHCNKCNEETEHRPKLDAVLNNCLVCNVCDNLNQNKNE
jgi:formylmethanofuran dehydrogenase subunit E